MARSRSLPTAFLTDPDYFELCSDTQAILVGLVLLADDEGRGLAHSGLLARQINKPEEAVKTALAQLQDCEMLQVYQVQGYRHAYFQLTRWNEWQTLSKPTPSKYPAPPCGEPTGSEEPQDFPGNPREILGNSGKPRETPPEEEGEEEREQEEKRREDEDEEEPPPANVVPFPTSPNGGSASLSQGQKGSDQESGDAPDDVGRQVEQVACRLGLPVSPELREVIEEFAVDTSLSLIGEAIEAAEYIKDPQRNTRRRRMSPGFFRSWVKRSQRTLTAPTKQVTSRRAASSDSPAGGTSQRRLTEVSALPDIADDPYRAYVERRSQQVRGALRAPAPEAAAGGISLVMDRLSRHATCSTCRQQPGT